MEKQENLLDIELPSKVLMFFFFISPQIMCTHLKSLGKVLLMSTHNIFFHGDIKESFFVYQS